MRVYQAEKSRSGVTARLVIGGTFAPTMKTDENGTRKEQWYNSRIPGVLEEVVLSVQAGQPVFLIGAFGGVAKLIIDLIRGNKREELTWNYQKRAPFAPEMRALYDKRGIEWMDYPEIASLFLQKGPEGINPLLQREEQDELFETVDSYRMAELIVQAMSRL